MHCGEHFRMLAHCQIVVGTPYRDLAGPRRPIVERARKPPTDAREIGELPVTALGPQFSERSCKGSGIVEAKFGHGAPSTPGYIADNPASCRPRVGRCECDPSYCWVKTGLLAGSGTGFAVVTSIFFFFFFGGAAVSPFSADFSVPAAPGAPFSGFFLILVTLVVLSVVFGFSPGRKAWRSFFFFNVVLSPAACTLAPFRRIFFAGCCGPFEKLVMNETPSSRRPGGRNEELAGEESAGWSRERPNNPKPCDFRRDLR